MGISKIQPVVDWQPIEGPFTSSVNHASPLYWATGVDLALQRVEDAEAEIRRDVRTPPTQRNSTIEVFHRQSIDCHFLLVAIRNVLFLADELIGKLDDPVQLDREVRAFRSEHAHAKDLRDILEHCRDYRSANGKLQRSGELPARPIETFLLYGPPIAENESELEMLVDGGGRRLQLKAAARHAIQIGQLANLLEARENGADVSQDLGEFKAA